jgi:hypothetical protein
MKVQVSKPRLSICVTQLPLVLGNPWRCGWPGRYCSGGCLLQTVLPEIGSYGDNPVAAGVETAVEPPLHGAAEVEMDPGSAAAEAGGHGTSPALGQGARVARAQWLCKDSARRYTPASDQLGRLIAACPGPTCRHPCRCWQPERRPANARQRPSSRGPQHACARGGARHQWARNAGLDALEVSCCRMCGVCMQALVAVQLVYRPGRYRGSCPRLPLPLSNCILESLTNVGRKLMMP